MDAASISFRLAQIRRRIDALRARVNQLNTNINKSQGKIDCHNAEINSCSNTITNCWSLVRKLENETAEHKGVLGVVKQGEAVFSEQIQSMRKTSCLVGDLSGTVRFAASYTRRMNELLLGPSHATAVANIEQAKGSVSRKINSLITQSTEQRRVIQKNENHISILNSLIRETKGKITEMVAERTNCQNEIYQLEQESGHLNWLARNQ